MADSKFTGDKKIPMKTLLADMEKKWINRNVSKFPVSIEGYHLTLTTILWSAGLLIFGFLAKSIADYLINPDNKALPKFQFAVLIYVIILTFPSLIIDVSGDVDYSWYVGLHKAAENSFVFGRDIVFTYGPLGFLTVPIFINKTLWAYSALYTLAAYAMVVLACSLFIIKMKANLAKTLIFAVFFVTVFKGMLNWRPGRDFELLISLFIFSYLYILSKWNLFGLLGLAFFCSVLPFIKFSSALAGGVTGFIFLCILLKDKRFKDVIIFLTAFVISFGALGLLLIGPPKAIWSYMYGCWEIASGYNDAMAIQVPCLMYLPAIIAWISYLFLLGYYIFKKRRLDVIFLLLIAGLLFSSFKLGFVRLDIQHLSYFHSMWLLLFGLFFLRSFAKVKIAAYYVLLIIFVLFCLCIANISVSEGASFPDLYMPGNIMTNLKNLRLSFNFFRGAAIEEQIEKNKMQLKRDFPLKAETIKMLTGHTIDVFQNDISITEAYDFKWNPRPVFQSYSAYTEYLDLLNAKHFQSNSAPEYILYALDSLNGRYAVSDEPATFRALLLRYEPCAVDANFIVLRKKTFADTEDYTGKEVTITAKFGQLISFSEFNNELVFAKVYVENSFLGLMQKILFKPPLKIYMSSKISEKIGFRSYQLVCPNARNGIFVSKFIDNQNDLLEIWSGDFQHNITGLRFIADHPGMFKDKITVRFFKIPFPK